MNCPRCGVQVEDVKFCPECGAALGEGMEAVAVASLAQDGDGVVDTAAAKPKRKMIWERHPAIIALSLVLIMGGVVLAAVLIVSLMYGLAMSGG